MFDSLRDPKKQLEIDETLKRADSFFLKGKFRVWCGKINLKSPSAAKEHYMYGTVFVRCHTYLSNCPSPWSLQEPETLQVIRGKAYMVQTYNRVTEALFPYKTPLLEQ